MGKGTESRVSRIERDYLILETCGVAPQRQFKTARVNANAGRLLFSLLICMFVFLFRETHWSFSPLDVSEMRAPLQAVKV